jgi:hypothetical protein
MSKVKELLEREDFFDAAILRHGFTDYIRDYEIIVGGRDGPPHTDYPEKEEPDGFIWGVRFAEAYPGLTYVENGERGAHWSQLLGRTMHEVAIETNCFHLRLIFADIRYAFLGNEPDVVVSKDMPINIAETP